MNSVLFWSSFDKEKHTSFAKWREDTAELSPFHSLTLQSHIRNCDSITLLTYQKCLKPQVPEGIEVIDADKIFPAETAFYSLLGGHHIAHISDAVRLLAATCLDSLVIDMDAVLLRPIPELDTFYCSMPAKMTGGFAPKWGKSHPPLTIWDKSWDGKALSAFPVKVGNMNKIEIKRLASKISETLSNPPQKGSKAWNYVMWTLKDMGRKEVNCKVFPPMFSCPLPAWLGKGKCYSLESPSRLNGKNELFGYKLPSIEEIMRESYIVQHFFESAFQDAEIKGLDFWEEVPVDSLVAKEAESIMGPFWQIDLKALSNKNEITNVR